MNIGHFIRFWRNSLGYTQLQLAKKANISRSYLAGIESGAYNPSLETLDNIARALNMTSGELLGTQNDTNNKKTPLVNEDAELSEYLEMLKNRPEIRMLFQVSKDATKEDVENAVKIIEALRKK